MSGMHHGPGSSLFFTQHHILDSHLALNAFIHNPPAWGCSPAGMARNSVLDSQRGTRRVPRMAPPRGRSQKGVLPMSMSSGLLISKVLTASMLMSLGDVLEQYQIIKAEAPHGSDLSTQWHKFDILRNIRQTTYGMVWIGPMCHFWYPTLDSWIPLTGSELELLGCVVTRVMIDQLLFSPLNLGTFIGWMTFWEEMNPDHVVERVKEEVPRLFPICLTCWIPVHMFTFSIIPDEYRVLWKGVFSILWGAVLSAAAAGELESKLRSNEVSAA